MLPASHLLSPTLRPSESALHQPSCPTLDSRRTGPTAALAAIFNCHPPWTGTPALQCAPATSVGLPPPLPSHLHPQISLSPRSAHCSPRIIEAV
ncbi:hypothetical protein CY34DRAFT_19666 [Suillus luteus UH-Slu-Lm8-n1]|uniref:Uncharacterized protein n=1 Tax=Suillus luteus UH-Slu-Lm8-n1 TaxID=930992 RepID=A0A0D0A0H5_9AGAM|nr:hypothetical protein CY34DRAFT_19666 [Suillus luteus UH-Slu-Lm8-n1]